MGMEEINKLIEDIGTEYGNMLIRYGASEGAWALRTTLYGKLKPLVQKQLREVAGKAVDMAQKCKSGSIVVGENIHVYTKAEILKSLDTIKEGDDDA